MKHLKWMLDQKIANRIKKINMCRCLNLGMKTTLKMKKGLSDILKIQISALILTETRMLAKS
jgi:hypothetical protein